jgi:phage-related protein
MYFPGISYRVFSAHAVSKTDPISSIFGQIGAFISQLFTTVAQVISQLVEAVTQLIAGIFGGFAPAAPAETEPGVLPAGRSAL